MTLLLDEDALGRLRAGGKSRLGASFLPRLRTLTVPQTGATIFLNTSDTLLLSFLLLFFTHTIRPPTASRHVLSRLTPGQRVVHAFPPVQLSSPTLTLVIPIDIPLSKVTPSVRLKATTIGALDELVRLSTNRALAPGVLLVVPPPHRVDIAVGVRMAFVMTIATIVNPPTTTLKHISPAPAGW